MSGKVILSFGDFKFRVAENAYRDLSRRISFKWSSVERLGQRPALFFDGVSDEMISLSGEIFLTETESPEQSMDQLREIGLKGKPETLVDASGNVLGKWVLTELEGNHRHILDDGRARYIEFSMGLKFYG